VSTKTLARPSKADRDYRRLLSHRTTNLLALGFNLSQTLQLARRNDVVHEAEALLERGWPHEYVTDELSD
jgi:hypothetical protein